jgi:flagellar motor switch protein FliN/FliY
MSDDKDSGSEQPGGAASEEPTMILDDQEAAQPDDLPDFASLQQDPSEPATPDLANPDLEMILDIPVTLSMEVGNTSISIRDLLQLGQGSVIELDRLAGEPLDVLVNGTLIAHGEVVVINDKFGIRMTDVISPSERIKKLG